MTEKWRLIVSKPQSGSWNMAVDEAISMAVSRQLVPPTIRFYQWSPSAISLGYFQSMDKEIDREACQKGGVDIVRRLTGGRAVLHHREFTYSLIAPETDKRISSSVMESYRTICGGLREGLHLMGVRAEITAGKKRAEAASVSAACFDAASWYELAYEGKKIIGSAQTRRLGCLLQHGSLPIEPDVDLLFSILKFPREEDRIRAKQIFLTKAAGLGDIVGFIPDFKELCRCFKLGFENNLKITLSQQDLLPEEISWAEELRIGKYMNSEWNGRK